MKNISKSVKKLVTIINSLELGDKGKTVSVSVRSLTALVSAAESLACRN